MRIKKNLHARAQKKKKKKGKIEYVVYCFFTNCTFSHTNAYCLILKKNSPCIRFLHLIFFFYGALAVYLFYLHDLSCTVTGISSFIFVSFVVMEQYIVSLQLRRVCPIPTRLPAA